MRLSLAAMLALAAAPQLATADTAPPHILQQPALSRDLIAFSYAGDLWTVPRAGGKAMRLTTGVGIESGPSFSPDGTTVAFTGDYDGNTDVFTVPTAGGVPHRVTYHPAADVAVGWSGDGKNIIFRSAREATSRYSQLFSVPAQGGIATRLPLPMAFAGQLSADGSRIAYSPLAPAFDFNFTSFTAWGNYHGGRAGTLQVTALPGLDTVEVPHEDAADFSPVFIGDKIYFLSGRHGPIGIYSYDPSSHAVAEIYRNTGPDIRSLATDGQTLIFDQLGELYTLTPGGSPKLVAIDVTGDMPDVRPHIANVADQIQNIAISPTGLRAVVEAHGEILTVPAKHGPVRNITNTPGIMEREPAWSPDGQSIAYFSDESGLYALHVASQTGAASVRKVALDSEPAYYFAPLWSPDSKRIAFHDNRLKTYVLDVESGKLSTIGEPDVFGGFVDEAHSVAWSPDSKWLAYPHTAANHLHVLMLYSVESGESTQLTDTLADARYPAFDRNGKYLYFTASNNAGATEQQLDMTSDLYSVNSSIYALTLKADTASPVAPESDDEKSPEEIKRKAKEETDATPAGQAHQAATEAKAHPEEDKAPPSPKSTEIDLAGLKPDAIARRIVALPLPAKPYVGLVAGRPGIFYFAEQDTKTTLDGGEGATLSRYVLADRKAEKLAERVSAFDLSADGEKMLLGTLPKHEPDAPQKPATYAIVAANAPAKAGEGALSLDGLEVRVDPPAEWQQMYREVWRIERAYFYDPHFHGVDTEAIEKKLAPYAAAIQSRADLNYVFQEMLTGFSVGHLRGGGGAIPSSRHVEGGLLGADYKIENDRYCIAKIYGGGSWTPSAKAPLAEPGLNIKEGDCILAIDGADLTAKTDIQQPLEGTAGHAVTLRIGDSAGKTTRDVAVVPVPSEAKLRNLDWIDGNRRKVDQLSGGKLAYVYLPDTGEAGFTAFNRYFFAQTDKQGAVIDERFNAGGQVANYIVEVLSRSLEAYWAPRYGAIDRSPAAAILGPKVMIANEASGSGGDFLPWLFKYRQLGPLVGKRTWGGLVGIGDVPVLMDGGHVTAPSVGFFSPKGEWDVENHGVAPDVPVEQDPKAVAAGHDPQLERAVTLALEKLNRNPPPEPKRPAYPNYHQ